MSSDREQLLGMGFSEIRVDKALKATKNSGLQPAIDWLFEHAEDPGIDKQEEQESGSKDDTNMDPTEGEIQADQQTAQSLKCDECGKLFRDAAAAEFHAVKSGHQAFSESSEAIKPLTAEEKAAKLEEIKKRLAARRAERLEREKQEELQKEKVRRRTGQELNETRERMKELEMKKALEEKRREKEEEKRAKELIRAQLEADKRERQRKAAEAKAAREGSASTPTATASAATLPNTSVSSSTATTSRLQIRLPTGAITNTFDADSPLTVVHEWIMKETGKAPGTYKLMMTFPRKVIEGGGSLRELGLVPNAALILQ